MKPNTKKQNDIIVNIAQYIVKPLPFDGSSGSKFYRCEIDSSPFLLKLNMYRKSCAEFCGDNKFNSASDTEVLILHELKKLHNKTPCIINLLSANKYNINDVTLRPCKTDSENCKMLKDVLNEHKKRVDAAIAHPFFAALFMEMCGLSMQEFIEMWTPSAINFAIFKSLLFHIFHCLHVIVEHYPQFRHNDLHYKNIMIKFDGDHIYDPASPKFIKLGAHIVPYFGMVAKIIDFDHAELPGIAISAASADPVFKFYSGQTDALNVISNISHYCREQMARFSLIEQLIDTIDPGQHRYLSHEEISKKIADNSLINAQKIINSPAFDEYLREIPAAQIIAYY